MIKRKKVVLFGLAELARTIWTHFTYDSDLEVVAFTADRAYCTERQLLGLPIVPFEDITQHYPPSDFEMFITLGYQRMNKPRAEKYATCKALGYRLPTYISSRAVVHPNNTFGDNVFIGDLTAFQPNARVGNDVLMFTGNLIGHDVVFGDHCFVSSHAVIGGNTKIGNYCFFGMNATARDGITIADETLLGAQVWIAKDTQPKDVYSVKATEPFHKKSDEVRI